MLIMPHISLTFPSQQQDIKHVVVCGSSANFSQKTFPEKITQNKVCICHKLCMYGSEFFSPWALVFRKARCLIRPRNLIRPRLQTSLTSFLLVRILLSTVSFLM